MNTWIVGAGPMAQAYAKVIHAMERPFDVIGRGAESGQAFEAAMDREVYEGGVSAALGALPCPSFAIVAVGVDQLAAVTRELIEAGVKHILLEKPAGINAVQVKQLSEFADRHQVDVRVAYNRRFYASTLKAEKIIMEDGGVKSALFEFTEWSHIVTALPKPEAIKQSWALANSSHVLDLAFHFCGAPVDWKSWASGELDWHPSARFCGAGITENNVLFSYMADWEGPGRWGLELTTRQRRVILRPMEKLNVMTLGSVAIEGVPIDDSLDIEYKPGLYRQVMAFYQGNNERLSRLSDHAAMATIYARIAGYSHK